MPKDCNKRTFQLNRTQRWRLLRKMQQNQTLPNCEQLVRESSNAGGEHIVGNSTGAGTEELCILAPNNVSLAPNDCDKRIPALCNGHTNSASPNLEQEEEILDIEKLAKNCEETQSDWSLLMCPVIHETSSGNYDKSCALLFTRDEASSADDETKAITKRTSLAPSSNETEEVCCGCRSEILALKNRVDTLCKETNNTLEQVKKGMQEMKSTVLESLSRLQQEISQARSGINATALCKSPKIGLKPPADDMEKYAHWFDSLTDEHILWAAKKSESKNLRSTVRSIIRLVMAKPVAISFTWTGSSEGSSLKHKFNGSPAHDFLLNVLSKTAFSNESNEDVRHAVQRTFHNAHDWDGGRGSRRRRHSLGKPGLQLHADQSV